MQSHWRMHKMSNYGQHVRGMHIAVMVLSVSSIYMKGKNLSPQEVDLG